MGICANSAAQQWAEGRAGQSEPRLPAADGVGAYAKPLSAVFDSLASAALVFAICIKLKADSIILAPPDFDIIKSGVLCSSEKSIALDILSPTTDPIDPPINEKSIAAITRGLLFTFP